MVSVTGAGHGAGGEKKVAIHLVAQRQKEFTKQKQNPLATTNKRTTRDRKHPGKKKLKEL